jgi:hypothetical protein
MTSVRTRHHCIITGTGRAGTTLLVLLLAKLGFDCGYRPDELVIDPVAHAGLEKDIRSDDAPYIVKSPWICTYVTELMARSDIVIDCAFVPIRSLSEAAESRRSVQRQRATSEPVYGGLWRVDRPEDQETELATLFYGLIHELNRKDVPVVFLDFPRFALDANYLYNKLSSALAVPPRAEFHVAFSQVVKQELISDFSTENRAAK